MAKRELGKNHVSDFLVGHLKEAIKIHHVYDGSNRLSHVYTALTSTDHGEKCMLTRYTYSGLSNRIQGMVEEESTWDSAWDI